MGGDARMEIEAKRIAEFRQKQRATELLTYRSTRREGCKGGEVLRVSANVGVKGISQAAASIKSTWRGVECKDTTFAVSPSGYMDDELGFAYISNHFEQIARTQGNHGFLLWMAIPYISTTG